jgi:hypothetical protein
MLAVLEELRGSVHRRTSSRSSGGGAIDLRRLGHAVEARDAHQELAGKRVGVGGAIEDDRLDERRVHDLRLDERDQDAAGVHADLSIDAVR